MNNIVNKTTYSINLETEHLNPWSTPAVDYTKKTKQRPHFCEPLGIYHADPLTPGNAKLDPSVLIFDLLAGHTCKNCSSCLPTCYAMKAQRQYPATYNKRVINTWLAENDRYRLMGLIEAQLARKPKGATVRVHSSGDFFSQDYVNLWSAIVFQFPWIQFYAYTKTDKLFDFEPIKFWGNFNLVHSILPSGELNYGSFEHCQEMARKYNAKICPYGIDSMKQGKALTPVKCGTQCCICMSNPYVVFKQH